MILNSAYSQRTLQSSGAYLNQANLMSSIPKNYICTIKVGVVAAGGVGGVGGGGAGGAAVLGVGVVWFVHGTYHKPLHQLTLLTQKDNQMLKVMHAYRLGRSDHKIVYI